MSSEYNYDNDAQFFPFFVLTITALITVPLTLSLFRTPSDLTSTSPVGSIKSSFRPEHADIINVQRSKRKRQELRLKRMLAAASGWLLMAYMTYLLAVTARANVQPWNPYEILNVPWGATTKAINSRYRRLSVSMHPDKRKPGPGTNETLDVINDEWVEITKAYKALTDDEIRENWEKYGHPDGKQSTSFGIALPTFLIAEGSGKWVLLVYGAMLAIGLPMLVGRWWYGAQKKTREKILVTTAGKIFREHREHMDMADVMALVSAGDEFRDMLGPRGESGVDEVQARVLAAADELGMKPKDRKRLREMHDPIRRKTLALLWAYVGRLNLGDKTLEAEKYEVAPTAAQLNAAFGSMALAFGAAPTVMSSFHLSQCLTQAIPPTAARQPILQLPHLTPDVAKTLSTTDRARNHLSLQTFMELPADRRQGAASTVGLPTDQLRVAESVARQLPYMRVEKAFFKVQGEKYIIPSSLVQLVIKARFIPPGTQSIPLINPKDLLDIDPAEGDLKAQKEEPEQHRIPLTHAPYLAQDRTAQWHVFLTDERQTRIAVPPFTFQHFTHAPFDAGTGAPTFAVVTLKMQFAAPPHPGEYRFHLTVVCDSYVGFDHAQPATLVVDDASKAREVDSDDDISDPEEGASIPPISSPKNPPQTNLT